MIWKQNDFAIGIYSQPTKKHQATQPFHDDVLDNGYKEVRMQISLVDFVKNHVTDTWQERIRL